MGKLKIGEMNLRHASLVVVVILAVGQCSARCSGQGFQPPTTVQLPTFGVSIDAEGVLESKMFAEPGGRIFAERVAALMRVHDRDALKASKLRKVSLRRLEEAIERRLAVGEPLDDDMLRLAGLTRLQYVFVDDENHDVILAGPAERWIEDASGRYVGITSGRPILLLDDLLAALRTFAPDRPADSWVGCTIDPTQDGLRRLAEFQRTIPKVISDRERTQVGLRVRDGMRESLGLAEIRVFGLSPNTNMAHILVEADYRMKLIGIGLEPPPVEMATFMSSLRSAQHQVLQRWWFTPNYECVRVTDDRMAMELVGQGVQLLSEEYAVTAEGRLEESGRQPSRASQLFTQAFTRKYPDIADRSPVYAQLRNMIDLLVAAAYLRNEAIFERAGWHPSTLMDEEQIAIETKLAPTKTPCVANAAWKRSRLIAPAGGGVSIQANQALKAENLLEDSRGRLATLGQQQSVPADDEVWWWD